MPWRLKFCQPLSGVFVPIPYVPDIEIDSMSGFLCPLPPSQPHSGPPKQQSVRNTMDEQQKQHDLTTQEEYHGTERRTDNDSKSADG